MISTDTASQTFVAGIQKATELQLRVVGIFLDLTKAYDVLNHNTLFDKLNTYGIRGNCRKWDGVVGTGWSWLRIGASGWHL
jgi:hypothetical protein